MKRCALSTTVAIISTLAVLSLFGLLVDNSYAELTAKANHDHIKVDFFYHGSTVSVRGVSEPGTDLIIKITSPERHETLREKGKVAGLLWMNVGELKIDHVPNVYFLHSTKKIEELLAPDEMNKYGLGYDALREQVAMYPAADPSEKRKWFEEFLKFKESSDLYETSSGQISLTDKDGKQDYYILTQWPYQAPPDRYTVTVYAVRGGRVIETATSQVLVEQVGLVKSFSDLAKNNGALFGLLAIATALGAGFGVGMIFRSSGGAH